jgi:hypothetical protein
VRRVIRQASGVAGQEPELGIAAGGDEALGDGRELAEAVLVGKRAEKHAHQLVLLSLTIIDVTKMRPGEAVRLRPHTSPDAGDGNGRSRRFRP